MAFVLFHLLIPIRSATSGLTPQRVLNSITGWAQALLTPQSSGSSSSETESSSFTAPRAPVIRLDFSQLLMCLWMSSWPVLSLGGVESRPSTCAATS